MAFSTPGRVVFLGLPSPSSRVCTDGRMDGRTLTAQPKFFGSIGSDRLPNLLSNGAPLAGFARRLRYYYDRLFSHRSRTYDLLVTGSDGLPLSYRRVDLRELRSLRGGPLPPPTGGGGGFSSCTNFFSLIFPLQNIFFRMQELFFWATRCAIFPCMNCFFFVLAPLPLPITFLMARP